MYYTINNYIIRIKIMPRNPYFNTFSVTSEQDLVQSLIDEAIEIHGQDLFYIPRTLVAVDDIIGEDRISEFKNAYPVVCYFDNITNFDGGGGLISKFGWMMDQSASLTISKTEWDSMVAQYGQTILPNRPAEGDLLYFPMTSGLFEIKYVNHQDPFYQLGRTYSFKLQVELFQYSSEVIDTGEPEIDVFETLKSYDTTINPDVDVPDSFGDNNKFVQKSSTIIFDETNPFGDL